MVYAQQSLPNALNPWKIKYNEIKFYRLGLNHLSKKTNFKKK